MKTTIKLLALLTAVFALAGCNKDKDVKPYSPRVEQERFITYTVSNNVRTEHMMTDTEFDALLERFCESAEGGDKVSFYNAKKRNTKNSGAKENVTFSTSDREAMKRWMREREDEGMTVTVTYDSKTGTYSGSAHKTGTGPQPPQQQEGCYTGVLVNQVDNLYPLIWQPANVMALQVSEDCTLVIDSNGFFFNEGTLEVNGVVYNVGDTVTLCGEVDTMEYDEIIFYYLNIGGPEPLWVDLGLPSGLLWANRNLGANHSGEHGELYSWGETQPKWFCTWSNYAHCVSHETDSLSMHSLTKYCSLPSYGYNGYSDTLTVLLPEDDAATVQWGNGARTPTEEDWDELINNCIFTKLPTGVWVAGPNGNTIFFPGNEHYVSYMSSTLLEEAPCWNIQATTINNQFLLLGTGYRYAGKHVRPVCSANK